MRERKLKLSINRNLVLALMVFLILPALITGYTYAVAIIPPGWFTDEAQTPINRFTAGTLIVEAGDTDGDLIVNGSSGDCEEIEFEVTNSGSKYSYVRAFIEGDWSYAYHTNTATVYAYAGDNVGTMMTGSDMANYIDGAYRGSFLSSYNYGISGLSWFTDYDGTRPLRITPTPGVPSPGEETGNGNGSINGSLNGDSGNPLGPPIVDGLFYAKVDSIGNIDSTGVSDSERYGLYAVGTMGSKMYTYLDGSRLYVAIVVNRNVNDNVFDEKQAGTDPSAYLQSAGWFGKGANVRPFNHLVNSEYMGFTLQMGDCTWEWKQAYANQSAGIWYSNVDAPGAGTPPPGYEASTSIVWNLNNSNWDYTLGGLADNSKWKSPYDNPNDVTNMADGSYPFDTSLPITFSYNHSWEWSMVYEFSVDLSSLGNCGSIDQLSIGNSSVHHSPSKTGDSDEFFTPRLNFKKYVSVNGGDTYYDANNPPFPILPEGLKPIFKFVVSNTGDTSLTIEHVDDDTFGEIFLANGSPITLAPGAIHSFYYPNELGIWDESVWSSFLSDNLIKRSGNLNIQFCDDNAANVDWVKHTDGYFYYKEALAPGETVTLCLKACPIDVPEGWQDYVFINLKAHAEAIQASNEAVYKVWFSDFTEGGIYPILFTPKPD